MSKIGRSVALLIILVFLGYLVYHNVNPAPKTSPDAAVPSSIASGRYPEFLKEVLKLEVRIEDKTIWIFLSNKSADQPVPSEEDHRAIVCTTEILDDQGNPRDSYTEFFRRPSYRVTGPAKQIDPGATEKFGYDIVIPHGSVRVKVAYVDFSVTDTPDAGKVPIAEQEVKF